MIIKGAFDVKIHYEPATDEADGIAVGRATGDKRFHGSLDGTSHMQMITALTPVKGSVSYTAVERISGHLEGKQGSFVVVHAGVMNRGDQVHHSITIAPDSGTGDLAGIRGTMGIEIKDGQHFYELDYTL
jgi:hypothetical protein